MDIDLARAEAMAARIGAHAYRCDVANAASAEATMARAIAAHGVPRILVNCASVGPTARIIGRDGAMPLAAFSCVIHINLIGTFNPLRLSVDAMSKAKVLEGNEWRVIINTASFSAHEGQVGRVS